MYRYIAAVWHARSVAGLRAVACLERLTTDARRWSVACEAPGLLAMHVEHDQRHAWKSYSLHGKSGVILGQLFDRRSEDHTRSREVRFDASETSRVIDTAGQHLLDHYWGSYLAILSNEGYRRHILRDPIGTLPCYHVRHAGLDLFFSHLEDCLRLVPLSLTVNGNYLAQWLLFSGVRTDATGLQNVTQLPRGERLTISPTARSSALVWDPTAFAAGPDLQKPDEAARALRSTVQYVVDVWASRFARIALKLSGGLDSSILAGCLAHSPSASEVIYLNLVANGAGVRHLPGVAADMAMKARAVAASGDERYYAQLVAQRWNRPLIVRPRDVSMDLNRLRRVPLGVAPALYFTVMELDDAAQELIASHGIDGFFSGQGGDAVLLATLQPLGSIDHAFRHRVTADLWRHIVASSLLSRDSIWSVLAKTIKHGLLRQPYCEPLRILDRPTLLDQRLLANLSEEDFDSSPARLARQSSLPPGKKNHVRGVANAFYNYVFDAAERAEHVDPLNSQPVWELMLSIPTETLLMNGIDRGLARHAFADVLPTEIRKRRTKGTGTLFYQEVVRRNRHALLSQLESGALVREGFLDRHELTKCLGSDEPSLHVPPGVILTYLAAEIWLQQLRSSSALDWRPAIHATCANGNIVPLYPGRGPRRTAARNETNPGYGA